MGLINDYRKFIRNLSNILAPLNELLKKKRKFAWSPRCEQAFISAKKAFKSDQILVSHNPKWPIVLATDASPYGVGGVLSHICPDGKEKVIQFASNTLNLTQCEYFQIEKPSQLFLVLKSFISFCSGSISL